MDATESAGRPAKPYRGEFDHLVELYSTSFAEHQVARQIGSDPQVDPAVGYWLRAPNKSAHHVWVWQLPGVVAIYGDHHIGSHRGVVSGPGVSLEWFGGDLESDYLASKFLTQRWTRERAIDELRDDSRWNDRPTAKERARLVKVLENSDSGEGLSSFNAEWDWPRWGVDDLPGHGYDLVELASLVVIQRTYRRLVVGGS